MLRQSIFFIALAVLLLLLPSCYLFSKPPSVNRDTNYPVRRSADNETMPVSQNFRIFLSDETSHVKIESPYGLYGNYPGSIANYFFRQLSAAFERRSALAASASDADVACGVKLVEINESNTEGLLTQKLWTAWAASEFTCYRGGRELKKRVETKSDNIYWLEDVILKPKNMPVDGPLFAKTPVGVVLNSLLYYTDKRLLETAGALYNQ
jgi:hypothetical protein